MTVYCRLTILPNGDIVEYEGGDSDTYEDALKKSGINPDTVLIISEKNRSIPQDAPIREKKVDIVLTCSRG